MPIQNIKRKFIVKSFDSRELLAGERKCTFLKYVEFNTGKPAVWCRLNPAIIVQTIMGWQPDRDLVLLTARFEGDSIDSISKFPFFSYLAIPNDEKIYSGPIVNLIDFAIKLNAELYES